MHGRVNPEVDSRQKALAAHLAQIRLFARVDAQVRIEITLADEHLLAHHARILAIVRAGVYLLMALAKTFGDETATADLADVRLHAEVTILVVQQRLLRLEVLSARCARIRLHVRVHSLVYDEIALTLESLAASRAIVIELTGVGGRVLRETDLAAKRLLARRALKRLLARVLAHVFLQFVIRSILLAARHAHLRTPLLPHHRFLLLRLTAVVAALLLRRRIHLRVIFFLIDLRLAHVALFLV